jgi:predicted nucleotidyltransferase
MRLDNKTHQIIVNEVAAQFGRAVTVRLFGSRVDDSLRGGDIDLLIESTEPLADRIQAECQLAARLFIKLGGRKVDVLIKDPNCTDQPIYQQAIDTGMML